MNVVMKKMVMVMVAGVLASASAAQAAQVEIIETWTGPTSFYGQWFNQVSPPFCQTFTVPVGWIGTQFEFFIEKGGLTTAGLNANIAVWSLPDLVLMGSKSTSYADPIWGGQTAQWIPVPDLNLLPGEYVAEMWATGGNANDNIYLRRSTTSTYEGGEARIGWKPGTPIGDNNDFMARVTVVPEPATMLLLVAGAGAFVVRRKR